MRNAVGCAALSCALGLAHGKALKWSNAEPRWEPPRETQALAYMHQLGSSPPLPTPAPRMPARGGLLAARASTDNTCGYIDGDPNEALYCKATARCMYNSVNSHIGCCADGETYCPLYTTCFDSSQSARISTDDGFTLWCGDAEYPRCITHLYQDDDLRGYTLLGCAGLGVARTGEVWYNPTETSTSSRSSRTRSPISDSDSEETTAGNSGATRTSTRSPQNTDSQDSADSDSSTSGSGSSGSSGSSSSPPIGAIVGGVVGGVAAIALLALGIWLLVRQHNKKAAAGAAAVGAVPPHQPSPHQPPPPGLAPIPSPVDPRMSQMTQMPPPPPPGAAPPGGYYDPAKQGAYSVSVGSPTSTLAPGVAPGAGGLSPPHSPDPHQMYQGYGAGAPPPPPPPGAQQFQGYHQPQHGYAHVAELSAERGDGEVRELQA